MNIEHRTSNIERRMNVFCLFQKRYREAIPSFVIRHSIFCGSLFNPGHPSDPSNHQKTVPFWRSFIRGFRMLRLAFLTPETRHLKPIQVRSFAPIGIIIYLVACLKPSPNYISFALFLNSNFCILPVEVLGNSQNMIFLGLLNPAIFFLQKSINSASVVFS